MSVTYLEYIQHPVDDTYIIRHNGIIEKGGGGWRVSEIALPNLWTAYYLISQPHQTEDLKNTYGNVIWKLYCYKFVFCRPYDKWKNWKVKDYQEMTYICLYM